MSEQPAHAIQEHRNAVAKMLDAVWLRGRAGAAKESLDWLAERAGTLEEALEHIEELCDHWQLHDKTDPDEHERWKKAAIARAEMVGNIARAALALARAEADRGGERSC